MNKPCFFNPKRSRDQTFLKPNLLNLLKIISTLGFLEFTGQTGGQEFFLSILKWFDRTVRMVGINHILDLKITLLSSSVAGRERMDLRILNLLPLPMNVTLSKL